MPENIIITGASEKYFNSFNQLLYSFYHVGEDANSRIAFYDLGLNERQARFLLQKFSTDQRLEYRKFRFEDYPEFVRPIHQTYSWKPIIISNTLNSHDGNLLWMDCGNVLLSNLLPIWNEISESGSFLPFSGSGNLKEWTVQETLDYMKVPQKDYNSRNRCGGLCGFDSRNKKILQMVDDWSKYALVRECIKPHGANRSNHRDDQSLLTILSIRAQHIGLSFSNKEVDISSSKPLKNVSVRNYLSNTVPSRLIPLSYQYARIRRTIDILINRIHG